MTFIKRTIKPVIFCLLSVTLSAFCIYEIIMTIIHETPSHLNYTSNTFLNIIIDTVSAFNERIHIGFLIGIGLLALLFELAFSDSMHQFSFCSSYLSCLDNWILYSDLYSFF